MQKIRWLYITLTGIPVFVLIYIIATFYYPGGTHAHPAAKGYSWTENYWCNLLDEKGLNGMANPARPVALSGMIVLCLSLAVFWNFFPQIPGIKKWVRRLVRYSGLLAMLAGAFLGTLDHDGVINVASLLGSIAVAGTIYISRKLRWQRLFILGLINIGLIIANRAIYETGILWEYLPVIQKITFVSVLLWIWLLAYLSQQVKQGIAGSNIWMPQSKD